VGQWINVCIHWNCTLAGYVSYLSCSHNRTEKDTIAPATWHECHTLGVRVFYWSILEGGPRGSRGAFVLFELQPKIFSQNFSIFLGHTLVIACSGYTSGIRTEYGRDTTEYGRAPIGIPQPCNAYVGLMFGFLSILRTSSFRNHTFVVWKPRAKPVYVS